MLSKKKVFWFTGLPSSGKTTLGNILETKLKQMNISSFLCDGDQIRKGLCKDLKFSLEDRNENLRRAAELIKILLVPYDVVIASFITPTNHIRKKIKEIISNQYIEIYLQCSINTCIDRDVKGLYKKAMNNEITDFSGISSPFEEPLSPNLTLDTENLSIHESNTILLDFVEKEINADLILS